MTKPESTDWLSLSEAAELLGVHPATVRNWADEGKIPSRRTAGKHRRFSKEALLRYAHTQPDLQPIEVQVILQNALGSARMQVGEGHLTGHMVQRHQPQNHDALRHIGRQVLDALRRYISSGAPDSGLVEAIHLGQAYARILSADHLTLPQATRGFFYFGEFVVNAVLTWTELAQPRSASDWATLLRQVNTFINAMLLSLIEYYEQD